MLQMLKLVPFGTDHGFSLANRGLSPILPPNELNNHSANLSSFQTF
jgi:hypothetical protein